MYKHILILPGGTELLSGAGTTNAIKSVKLTELVNSGPELVIGSCCCDMLEATIFAPGGNLNITSGEQVILYKESSAGQRLKLGAFTVEAPTRPTANTLKIVGYDHVAKLDKDLTAWVDALEGWPYSVNDFASMVCRECGVTFVPSDMINAGFSIRQWRKSGVTGRQILRWLGEIACRFVHADPDGNIRFGWYADSGKTLTPAGENYYFAGSLSYENYQVAPVDAVQLRLSQGDAGALWPAARAGDNAYIITGNPILNAHVTEDLIPCLEAIRAELAGAVYTPCQVSGPADPAVGAGSILTVTDPGGREFRVFVMEKTSTGQRDTYCCTGSPRRDSATALYSQTNSEKNAQAAVNAAAGLTQQDVFNRLTDNGKLQGIYIQDGKWYINAELVKVINLIADHLNSKSADAAIDISGGMLNMFYGAMETVALFNNFGPSPLFTLQDYEEGAPTDLMELSPRHLKLGGTSTMPLFYISTSGGKPKLWLNGEMQGKTLSWKDNGDGTYTLMGT